MAMRVHLVVGGHGGEVSGAADCGAQEVHQIHCRSVEFAEVDIVQIQGFHSDCSIMISEKIWNGRGWS